MEYAGSDAGYGMAIARSRNWSESVCIVEVKNVLRCLGREVACRGSCSGRLSPADNMLSDHTQAQSEERSGMIMKCSISHRKTWYYNSIYS